MNIPVMVLLGFAAWTLLTLFASVGVYRWSRILTGRTAIGEWRADLPHGSDWYRRAMRAHMNCVENLPVYTAIVVALIATGVKSAVIDMLAIAVLAARIAQTLVHIGLPPVNAAAGLRFAFFFVQAVCMIAMGVLIASAAAGGGQPAKSALHLKLVQPEASSHPDSPGRSSDLAPDRLYETQ